MVKAIKILGLLLMCLSVYASTVTAVKVRMTYDGTNIYDTPITVVGVDSNNSFTITFTTNSLTLLQSSDGTNWTPLLTTGYDSSRADGPTNYYQGYYGPYFTAVVAQLQIPDAPVLTAK